MPEHNTNPSNRPQDSAHDLKPDLRLVAAGTDTPAPEPPEPEPGSSVDAGLLTPAEAAPGTSVKPLVPLDQRLFAYGRLILQTAPRWAEQPPSLAQIWDYSTNGDWTDEEKSSKRLAHALIVVITFVALYPITWAVQLALHKPVGFVLTVAVLFVVYKLH